MARTKTEKTRLGIFVVIGTLFILAAAYLIGNNQSLFSKTFGISTVFNNVNGLQLGNNVRFSGINVGTVKAIEMENDTTIRVRMAIEEKMRSYIKKDAIVTIGSDGLVGSMLVNIIPGEGRAPLISSGDELQSYSKLATQDMLTTLNVTNENAALLTSDLLKVTQSLIHGKGTLGRLLNDTVMAEDLQHTIVSLKHASNGANMAINELNAMVQTINFGESAAGVLLGDTVSGGKMRAIITHLESSSTNIDSMVKDLNTVIGEVKDGKGAVDYLTKDTVLVKQLETTIRHIEEGTARFNENMEALKHNFLFRRYFKKLEKEKEKNEKG